MPCFVRCSSRPRVAKLARTRDSRRRCRDTRNRASRPGFASPAWSISALTAGSSTRMRAAREQSRIVPETETHSPRSGVPSGASSLSTARVHALGRLRSLGHGRRSVWAAAMALLVLAGALASVLGARAVARSDAENARLTFHLASADVASTLKRALQHEEDLVFNARAFVTGNPKASAADFDRWTEWTQAMRRYPELQVFGLVTLVPASRLAAFEAHMAANPLRPLGPQSVIPNESFQVLPPGRRPYYCLAVAGLARNAATVLPGGLG